MRNLDLHGEGELEQLTPIAKKSHDDNLKAFWDYLGTCTARGAASERTKLAYGAAIGLFLRWCQCRGFDPRIITRGDIEDWRAALLSDGASPGTVMLKLSAIQTFYKALCRAGMCTINPAQYVKSPKPNALPVDRVLRKIVFPDQMIPVLRNLGDDSRGRRDRALILLFYLLGLRVSEAAGLNWSDWTGDTIRFKAKGGQARELGVPAPLKEAFTLLRGDGIIEGPIFLGNSGRLTVRGIQKMVVARLKSAGLPGRNPHSLRHSCATVAAIGGSSSFAIQDQLGHASQRTTAIYTRVAGRFLEAPSVVVARTLGL